MMKRLLALLFILISALAQAQSLSFPAKGDTNLRVKDRWTIQVLNETPYWVPPLGTKYSVKPATGLQVVSSNGTVGTGSVRFNQYFNNTLSGSPTDSVNGLGVDLDKELTRMRSAINTYGKAAAAPSAPIATTLLAGLVATGEPGSNVKVTIRGDPPTQYVDVIIPQGLPGTSGLNGLTPAIANVISTTLPANAAPTAIFSGPITSLTLTMGIPAGPAGTPGAAGPPNSLAVGTVTTGAPGSAVTFTITGTPPNQVVNVSIPQGFSGVTGATPNLTIGTITTIASNQQAAATIGGTPTNPVLNLSIPQGAAGTPVGTTLSVGTVTTGAPGSQASVTITGTPPNQVVNLTIPQGFSGAAGATPTFTIGTISTGAAGSSASATITGTSPNLVLNLTIPQGTSGTPGANGVTPSFTIGTVSTLSAGANATASVTGTAANPVLNLGIPQGQAGSGGGAGVPSFTDPASFASATADQVDYDNNRWKRSPGTVQTDPVEQNGKYTATQYNGSGSFHYDRQFDGPVYFRWWQRASADNHNRLRAMLNSGYSEMKVDSGTYYFDSYAWTPNNFRITGDVANPSKVKFVLRGANALDNSPNTRIFRGWFWYNDAGIPFENITIEGIRFINECTATITGTPNNATGSNAAVHFDGSVQRNINVNRCEYVQRSKTAATNFAYFKAGPNKLQENIVVSNSRTDNPDSTRARMFVEFVNQDAPNNNKVAGRGIQVVNCFIRGVYYGTSIAGNYDNALVERVTYENCRDYGSEFAGKNANATLLNCRFGGTHNVLFVSNYHGDNGTSSGDPAIPANSGQQFIGNRTLGYVPGIVELRGSGNLFMQNNNLNISGGLYLRANSLGGVISGDLKDNTITTNAIATNMTNKAVVFLEGATNIRAVGNTFNRTSTDTQPMVQAASSTAQDGATGTASTGSQFINNFLYSGAGTLSSYFSATAPNSLSIATNYNATGQINQ